MNKNSKLLLILVGLAIGFANSAYGMEGGQPPKKEQAGDRGAGDKEEAESGNVTPPTTGSRNRKRSASDSSEDVPSHQLPSSNETTPEAPRGSNDEFIMALSRDLRDCFGDDPFEPTSNTSQRILEHQRALLSGVRVLNADYTLRDASNHMGDPVAPAADDSLISPPPSITFPQEWIQPTITGLTIDQTEKALTEAGVARLSTRLFRDRMSRFRSYYSACRRLVLAGDPFGQPLGANYFATFLRLYARRFSSENRANFVLRAIMVSVTNDILQTRRPVAADDSLSALLAGQ